MTQLVLPVLGSGCGILSIVACPAGRSRGKHFRRQHRDRSVENPIYRGFRGFARIDPGPPWERRAPARRVHFGVRADKKSNRDRLCHEKTTAGAAQLFVPGLGLAGGSTDNLMRLYAPFFVSSGCGSMPNTVISPLSGPYAQKKAAGGRSIVFQVGLKHFEAVPARQIRDLVRDQTIMMRILPQEIEGLDQFSEILLLVGVELSLFVSDREIGPVGRHLGQSHADGERHGSHSSVNRERSIGAEASPFLRLAADWSSIFSVRAEMASDGTNTRGSSMNAPFEYAFT